MQPSSASQVAPSRVHSQSWSTLGVSTTATLPTRRLTSAAVIGRLGWFAVVIGCLVGIALLILATLPLARGAQPLTGDLGWLVTLFVIAGVLSIAFTYGQTYFTGWTGERMLADPALLRQLIDNLYLHLDEKTA